MVTGVYLDGAGVDKPEDAIPADLSSSAQRRAQREVPQDYICLVTAERTYASYPEGKPSVDFCLLAHPVNSAVEVNLWQSKGFHPAGIPVGSIIHLRTCNLYRPEGPDEILYLRSPRYAVVTKNLRHGHWRAKSAHGETFEFDESSNRFLCGAGEWPKVGKKITYHGTPSDAFAIMVPAVLPTMLSTGRYNSYIDAGKPIPTFEQVQQDNGKEDKRRAGLAHAIGYVAAPIILLAATAVYGAAKATGMIGPRFEPRQTLWLPEGYGKKPPAP
jgi:hypothetical protein